MSIKDFGAVGDGFFDDTTAFEMALKSRAVKIKVPPGQYCITRDVNINDSRLVSVGRG